MNIDHLLKDIAVRHACKNVSKYVSDFENAVNIKLVQADNNNFEFTWSADFEWYVDALNARDIILEYIKQKQNPKMFSAKYHEISDHYKLSFKFKFHPENAV